MTEQQIIDLIASLATGSERMAGGPFTPATGGAWMEGVYTGLAIAAILPEDVGTAMEILERDDLDDGGEGFFRQNYIKLLIYRSLTRSREAGIVKR